MDLENKKSHGKHTKDELFEKTKKSYNVRTNIFIDSYEQNLKFLL